MMGKTPRKLIQVILILSLFVSPILLAGGSSPFKGSGRFFYSSKDQARSTAAAKAVSLTAITGAGGAFDPGIQLVADPANISTCLNRMNIPKTELHWLYIPENSAALSTQINYMFLAGQLIENGAIDASMCPAGGLSTSGYANPCGFAQAQAAVYELQNIYDDDIMLAWREVGTPPVMLKQMIRYESQFWPMQWGPYHYGLGHLTYVGADTALMWNYTLFKEVCALAYGSSNCLTVDDTMIGTLLGAMTAPCSTCEYKIDIPKAQRSIHYLAESLLAYCFQTATLVYMATGEHSSESVNYPTIWKLTLMNYNAGASCVYNAVKAADAASRDVDLTWEEISNKVVGKHCSRGWLYSEQITAKFYDFPPPENK